MSADSTPGAVWAAAPARPCQRGGSALQILKLVGHAVPLLGVRKRPLAFGQYRPLLRQLGVDFKKMLLVIRQVVVGIDGFDGRSEEHTSELQSRGHLVC